MSTMTTGRPDVEAYLAAVRSELADLSPEERDELLLDVEASIVDAADESDAPIAARLGSPADFASELRSAAGLTPAGRAPRRAGFRELWESPQAVAARKTLAELAPIWWVARAYVAVALLAWVVAPDQGNPVPPLVRVAGVEFGIVLTALATVLSVAIGLWQRRTHAAAKVALVVNLLLAGASVPVYAQLLDWITDRDYATTYVVDAPVTDGLAYNGTPLENVYAFSRDGRLLLDVLLYDSFGRPLEVRPLDTDPTRRVLRRRDGGKVFNSFPVRYYDDGTQRVARPGSAPVIDWSPIETPPLRREPARKP